MLNSMLMPNRSFQLVLSLVFLSTMTTAHGLDEIQDLDTRFPGRVFLYHGTPDLASPEGMNHLLPASVPGQFMNNRIPFPGPQFFGGRLQGAMGQKAGSGRVKLLGRAFEEGGMAYAVAAHDNYCYVGTSGSLSVFDVTNPSAPVLVQVTEECVGNLEKEGSLLGAIAGCKGELVLFDLTDPAKPLEVSRLSPPQDFFYINLALSGSTAVVTGYGYLDLIGHCAIMQVIDTSNPSAPEVISTMIGVFDFYYDVLLDQDTLYLSISGDGIGIFDISNPMYMTQHSLHKSEYLYVTGMDYNGGYLYLAGNGLEIVDVSDPEKPTPLAQLGTPYYADIRYSGGNVYFANENDQTLWVVDVTDPYNPASLGQLMPYGMSFDLFIMGNTVYIPDMVFGLLAVDITTPSAPQLLSMTPTGTCPFGIDVEGDLAAVTANFAQMHTLDVSDPFAPEVLGFTEQVPDPSANNTYYQVGIDLSGDTVVTGDWAFQGTKGSIHTFDVTTPSLPEHKGDLNITGDHPHSPVTRLGNLVYTGADQLLVVDISDPANPVQVGVGPSFSVGNISDIKISGTTCYVSCYMGDLSIVDISNPTVPQEIHRIPISAYIPGIAVEDHLLGVLHQGFLGASYQYATYLEIYDVSNPLAPILLGSVKKPISGTTVMLGGTTLSVEAGLFFLCAREQLFVIDGQDPTNPFIAAAYPESPCYLYTEWFGYSGVCVANGQVYLAGHDGLEVLRYLDVGVFLTPKTSPLTVPRGESLDYEIRVENFTSSPQQIKVWVDEVFSGNSSGPKVEPVWVTLEAGENIIRLRQQGVPANAPIGTYELFAHVIDDQGMEVDNDKFTFEVTL